MIVGGRGGYGVLVMEGRGFLLACCVIVEMH